MWCYTSMGGNDECEINNYNKLEQEIVQSVLGLKGNDLKENADK